MRSSSRTPALFVLLALTLAAPAARAQALRLVASDDQGVTLRLDLPAWRLVTDPASHRQHLDAPGLQGRDEPGRPQVPGAGALLAVPDGARVSATVIAESDEQMQEHVALSISGRPGWSRDPYLGTQPTVEDAPAILDGPWPRATLELGEPFVVRHQRVVVVTVQPFRYDEATGRLWSRSSVTVRVSFAGSVGRSPTALVPVSAPADPMFDRALLNPDQGRRFRLALTPARASDAARFGGGATSALGVAAFDESDPEVRVRVDSTGVQAFLYDDLAANGYPAGVPIAQVSVHRHEYVDQVTPPYVTFEVPCEVVDANADGVFDSGDAVYVYAQTWAQRARATIWQRGWGDADYLFVTRLGRPGLRLATRAGWRDATGLTPLASYPFKRHYETQDSEPTDYYGAPPDTVTDPIQWIPQMTYYDRPDTMTFTATDLDTSRSVSLAVQEVGRRSEGRLTFSAVRNKLGQLTAVIDSAVWAGKATVTFSAVIHGSALTEGVNDMRFWGRVSALPPDPVGDPALATGMNWFEVTHWRAYRAIQGYLPCTSADGAGLYQVQTTGFPSNAVEVWDVTDSTAAVRLQLDASHLTQSGGRWNLEFQDSTVAGQPRQYVVFDTPRIAPATAYSAVTRRHLSEGTAHDYLLVVPAAWESAVGKLVEARQAQGLDVLVAPYEAIRDEFNGGRPSAYAIKRFIQYAYANWGTRYVTLVGDAGGPNATGLYATGSTEWLPTMMIRSPVGASIGGEYALELVPSDAWYGWCVDARCIDPSAAPKLHDVFVGRLPVNSAAEAAALSAKLQAYDDTLPDLAWRRNMTLLADDLYSGDLFGDFANSTYCRHDYEAVFSLLSREARDIVVNEGGLTQSNPEVFDMQQWLANERYVVVASGDTCRPQASVTQADTRAAVTPELRNRLSAGRLWWNFQGHANEYLLAHEHIWYVQGAREDELALANDAKPFFFSAFSCHANNFVRQIEHEPDFGPCVGEGMVLLPTRGAIAAWASSGFELIPSNDPAADHVSLELARALFSQVPPDTSVALRQGRDPYAHPVLGDAIALALMKWYQAPGGNVYTRQEGISYELLGDPATRLSVGLPQTAVTANGTAVTAGQPVRLHTPGNPLTLVADLVSNTALARILLERTVGTVHDTLPPSAYVVSPAFPDTARGGLGGRRFRVTYADTLAPQSYDFVFRTVDRQGRAASFDVALPFQTVLRAEGTPIADGDVVSPSANLTLLVLSPAPIADPAHQLVVRVNGVVQAFSTPPVANPGDASGREWILTWAHAPYPVGDYAVGLEVDGRAATPHTFKVTITSGELRVADAMLFPNPFQDELGAFFSFNLESGRPADVLIRVYTVSGRLVYRRFERQLAPGYHQLPWDGRDAEGDKLANGVYFYRLQASNGPTQVTIDGRIVKLRRPNHEVVVGP